MQPGLRLDHPTGCDLASTPTPPASRPVPLQPGPDGRRSNPSRSPWFVQSLFPPYQLFVRPVLMSETIDMNNHHNLHEIDIRLEQWRSCGPGYLSPRICQERTQDPLSQTSPLGLITAPIYTLIPVQLPFPFGLCCYTTHLLRLSFNKRGLSSKQVRTLLIGESTLSSSLSLSFAGRSLLCFSAPLLPCLTPSNYLKCTPSYEYIPVHHEQLRLLFTPTACIYRVLSRDRPGKHTRTHTRADSHTRAATQKDSPDLGWIALAVAKRARNKQNACLLQTRQLFTADSEIVDSLFSDSCRLDTLKPARLASSERGLRLFKKARYV
ncbi:unnamed protein product [Protopolystoma xenopodis]|uniref:Uncharacterized protein n=1 Tax=Protopolystoma xenopodis TaxID=117903 RepID=A0A448WG35_9PLAT|nr:unnamed protein product [Protopolystoma xenopodis]